MSEKISQRAFRRFVFTIGLTGVVGAALGLMVARFVPEKWSAEAVILIGQTGSGESMKPVEPATLVLERIRSSSFLKAALEPKGLGGMVEVLDPNTGGQLSASVIRQADAVRIQVLDRSAASAAAAVSAIYEALQADLDKDTVRLQHLLHEQQASLAAEAKSAGSDSSRASESADLLKEARAIDVQLAALRPTHLLSPVSVSSRPVFPKPSYFTLAGLIAGLLIGYVVAVARRLLGFGGD